MPHRIRMHMLSLLEMCGMRRALFYFPKKIKLIKLHHEWNAVVSVIRYILIALKLLNREHIVENDGVR